ncbi:K02A2.6-like [Cordylochernes scorpioides]|uniref:K02A2.6-like n=1 Tax=Cordylochernes scorpioides TaxID=51811 RepID=A0ABY6KH47_9ARAC|nr:K02A2.6-like [Cordylochernes scorpioides]
MDTLLIGIDEVAEYMDDVLISGINYDDLNPFWSAETEAGLCLKRDKCKFYVPEIEFFGMKIDNKGIHLSEEKLRAIKDYERFLRNTATVVEPLHRLLDSINPWKWNRENQRDFEEAKS